MTKQIPRIPMGPKGETRRVSFNILEDLSYTNPEDLLPPLYMQYNPQSWNHSYKKIITRTQTLSAYIEEYWGDELDTISANSTTGGFISEDHGYTTYFRRETKPFQKFQSILDIYNNNGNIYDAKGNIVKKGSVIMYYDEGSYIGFFESLNYSEDSLNPYRFTFDFVFKVIKSLRGY
jgi:hypothetical protein